MTPASPPIIEAALSLALAVVGSSNAPLVLLDGDLIVVAASATFCRAFNIDPEGLAGRSVFELGAGEWNVPQFASLLKATISGRAAIDAYEMDLKRPDRGTRRLILNAHKLAYNDAEHPRLLLSVVDVTDARLAAKLKDEMVREKAILLEELRHRVANSLQIIASILLQSARSVDSQETREHLNQAHHRVMSIADVQKKLSVSSLSDVELRDYFTDLCRSIGASMIRDHNQISINVKVDDSVAGADASVSLGLIVTELVINALKHAFPEHRNGKISVDYESKGGDWTLAVGDDGVGMPTDPQRSKAGLGVTIIQALAKQLHARVVITDNHPGTGVSIVHP